MFLLAEWALHGPEGKEIVEQFNQLPDRVAPFAFAGGLIGWGIAAAIEWLPAIVGIIGGAAVLLALSGSVITSN